MEFLIPKGSVSLVIDFFGKHVRFTDQTDGTVSCRIRVSREAMKRWAVQFAGIAKVVSPPELVEEIREEIRKAAEQYDLHVRSGLRMRTAPARVRMQSIPPPGERTKEVPAAGLGCSACSLYSPALPPLPWN